MLDWGWYWASGSGLGALYLGCMTAMRDAFFYGYVSRMMKENDDSEKVRGRDIIIGLYQKGHWAAHDIILDKRD